MDTSRVSVENFCFPPSNMRLVLLALADIKPPSSMKQAAGYSRAKGYEHGKSLYWAGVKSGNPEITNDVS